MVTALNKVCGHSGPHTVSFAFPKGGTGHMGHGEDDGGDGERYHSHHSACRQCRQGPDHRCLHSGQLSLLSSRGAGSWLLRVSVIFLGRSVLAPAGRLSASGLGGSENPRRTSAGILGCLLPCCCAVQAGLCCWIRSTCTPPLLRLGASLVPVAMGVVALLHAGDSVEVENRGAG